jgi:hypothetical protein
VLEEFVVASWDDHLRQHERVTKREQAHLERVRELTDPDHPVTVTHWLAVSSRSYPDLRPSRRDVAPSLGRQGDIQHEHRAEAVQGRRGSGRSELRGPGQERPRPENLRTTNWSNYVYLGQTTSGSGARNGTGVNSRGNTASRTLLVLNSLV